MKTSMHYFAALLCAGALFTSACSKTDNSTDNASTSLPVLQRSCGAMEALHAQLQQDPTLGARMQAIGFHNSSMLAAFFQQLNKLQARRLIRMEQQNSHL